MTNKFINKIYIAKLPESYLELFNEISIKNDINPEKPDFIEVYRAITERNGTADIYSLLDLGKQVNVEPPRIVESTLEGLISSRTGDPMQVGIVAAKTSSYGSDTVSIQAALVNAAKSGHFDIVVAPEYSFMPSTGPLSRTELDRYLDFFKEASTSGTLIIPGSFIWQQNGMLYNSCFFIQNGKVIYQYEKNIDGGEDSIAKRFNLKPSYGTHLGTFDWDGLKMGVEICADGGILSGSGVHDRDILFLISCGNDCLRDSMYAVRQGGYGIVAEGSMGTYASQQQEEQPWGMPPRFEKALAFYGKITRGELPPAFSYEKKLISIQEPDDLLFQGIIDIYKKIDFASMSKYNLIEKKSDVKSFNLMSKKNSSKVTGSKYV